MVDVRFARPEEREAVAAFMQEVFPRAKWSIDGWRRLLSGRWSGPEGPYAILACDGARIAGVLGIVSATRPSATGDRKTANMTSWYVLKPYRGQGLGHRMIALACSDPAVTVTNFTSSANAVDVVQSAGLSVLDRERFIWRPRATARPLPVRDAPAGDGLPPRSMRILEDHRGLGLAPHVVETPDGPCLLLISRQRRSDAYESWEVCHLSDRAIFAAHDRAIADSLLPGSGAVLSCDSRLVDGAAEMDAVEALSVPRFYSTGAMAPAEVDPLYSEVVLLNMKLA
ncbi:GNAT family N-acetyltransferase [Sulfitobacter sp. LCG007]